MIICKSEGSSYKKLIGYKKGQGNVKYTLQIALLMLLLGMSGMDGLGNRCSNFNDFYISCII